MPDSAPLPEESVVEATPKRLDDIGSLSAFWEIIEPILELLGARRLCEVGVAEGKFAQLLLAWSRRHDAVYYGVDPAPAAAFQMRFEKTARRHSADARPIVFLHDVTWPWARRDMYYSSSTVPADARHPSSDQLGVLLGRDELVDGGMRTPGLYSIALHPGGPKNGVLTAVEDFLSSPVGHG